MKNTIVGVDLAKNIIQVCVYTNKKVHSNTEMTPDEFIAWLANSTPITVVFEACGTSNYWKQKAISLGHDARLISAKLVGAIRQNQKTDKNDALAIVQATLLPDVVFISGKSTEQQQLQSIMRFRELSVKQKVASGNQLKALLLEFNIKVSSKLGGLKGVIKSTLEDAENGLTFEFRDALSAAWAQYLSIIKAIDLYDECLNKSIETHPDCKKLLKIEGVGPLNAVNLYIALGCAELGTFTKGKDASACIGLTPIQHSSGGKAKIGTIGRHVKNSRLRTQLITGAMSVIHRVTTRASITKKDAWLKSLIERRGKKCAAVALANKTVRTAYTMLTKNTEYTAEILPA
jgi:transposase